MTVKKIFILLSLCLLSFSVLSESCVGGFSSGEATRIVTTELVHLNKVEYEGIVYVDPIDVEFWVEECIGNWFITYTLMATVEPTNTGFSRGSSLFDVSVIQDNLQYSEVWHFIGNLYAPAITTTWIKSDIDPDDGSVRGNLDLRQPFTIVLSCNNAIAAISDECIEKNPTWQYDVYDGNDNNLTLTSVNGLWFDPAYNGSGFNVVQTTSGFLMYFYGYKDGGDGETLWLVSSIGPEIIRIDETFSVNLVTGFIGNGGSLTSKPITANSGIAEWGVAEITFHSCTNGTIKLIKTDGNTVTHEITPIIGIEGLSCNEY